MWLKWLKKLVLRQTWLFLPVVLSLPNKAHNFPLIQITYNVNRSVQTKAEMFLQGVGYFTYENTREGNTDILPSGYN